MTHYTHLTSRKLTVILDSMGLWIRRDHITTLALFDLSAFNTVLLPWKFLVSWICCGKVLFSVGELKQWLMCFMQDDWYLVKSDIPLGSTWGALPYILWTTFF